MRRDRYWQNGLRLSRIRVCYVSWNRLLVWTLCTKAEAFQPRLVFFTVSNKPKGSVTSLCRVDSTPTDKTQKIHDLPEIFVHFFIRHIAEIQPSVVILRIHLKPTRL